MMHPPPSRRSRRDPQTARGAGASDCRASLARVRRRSLKSLARLELRAPRKSRSAASRREEEEEEEEYEERGFAVYAPTPEPDTKSGLADRAALRTSQAHIVCIYIYIYIYIYMYIYIYIYIYICMNNNDNNDNDNNQDDNTC